MTVTLTVRKRIALRARNKREAASLATESISGMYPEPSDTSPTMRDYEVGEIVKPKFDDEA